MSASTRLNLLSFINLNRADFSQPFIQADPRMYYRVLGGLNYIIPHLAHPVFMQLIQARCQIKGAPVNVLDLGCSYGVNGILMKYPLTWDMLHDRYCNGEIEKLTAQQLEDYDRHFFQSWPKRRQLRVVGVDRAHGAVRYAERTGGVDRGFAIDLETDEPPPDLAAALADVDLIVSTGSVGCVTERSFSTIARYAPSGARAPWVASFVLRVFPYDGITRCLAGQGLETERFEGATFVERRFVDREEMDGVIEILNAAGLDTAGKEDCGVLHAELYVSRPAEEIARCPINRLISVASGVNRLAVNPSFPPMAGNAPSLELLAS